MILFPDLGAATTDTVMTLGTSQTVTGNKTFNSIIFVSTGQAVDVQGNTYVRFGGDTYLVNAVSKTPDEFSIQPGTTSNSIHINEFGDSSYDFQNCTAGTSAATDPLFCIHSHNQTTTC